MIKHSLLLFFLLITSIYMGFTQDLQWAVTIGSEEGEQAYSVAVDKDGSIYTAGYFFNTTVDFDPGENTHNLTGVWHEIFIQKLDAQGRLVWVKSLGSSNRDVANSLVLDETGHLFITGQFHETIDFNPGEGVFNMTARGEDAFILKLDTSGVFIWAKSIGSPGFDSGDKIVLDTDGNIYVAGKFGFGTTEPIDLDPGAGEVNKSPAGIYDNFILKLDPSGNYVWGKTFGGTNNEWFNSFKVDASGNVYTLGAFLGTVDFDPGVATVNHTSAGEEDFFIQKLDADGNLLWVKTFGSSLYDNGYGMELDADNNIYLTGFFKETIDMDPGTGTHNFTSEGLSDAFVLKLNTDGDFVWANQYGGTSFDIGQGIVMDKSGNFIINGSFNGTVDFEAGVGSTYLTSTNGLFFLTVDASGMTMHITKLDANSKLNLFNTTVDEKYYYAVGDFNQTVDFDITSGTHNLMSKGLADIIVLKYAISLLDAVQKNTFNITPAIYPNPTEGSVTIRFGENISNLKFEIINSNGNVIYHQYYKQTSEIQTSFEGPAGLYAAVIKDGEGRQMIVKLIKQ
jgi:hypothetical protein